jgi:hypothetical protein
MRAVRAFFACVLIGFSQFLKLAFFAILAHVGGTDGVFTRRTRLASSTGLGVAVLVPPTNTSGAGFGFVFKSGTGGTKFTRVLCCLRQFLKLAFFANLAHGSGIGGIKTSRTRFASCLPRQILVLTTSTSNTSGITICWRNGVSGSDISSGTHT